MKLPEDARLLLLLMMIAILMLVMVTVKVPHRNPYRALLHLPHLVTQALKYPPLKLETGKLRGNLLVLTVSISQLIIFKSEMCMQCMYRF